MSTLPGIPADDAAQHGVHPRRFTLADAAQRVAWQRLAPRYRCRDLLPAMVEELAVVREPRLSTDAAGRAAWASQWFEDNGGALAGCWVCYPWRDVAVRLLPAAEFRAVRLDRNRHKITGTEQQQLREATIAIVGLSVGHSVALCLALEGVGGRFRLADPDTIALSNLNRIPATVLEIGTNKACVAARRIYEIDPWAEIDLWPQGLDESGMDAFLAGVSVLVDECDDLFLKAAMREHARSARIPVVMETNDRGLIDIERFDLEPDRPVLHGLWGAASAADMRGLDTREKVPYVIQALGADTMSARALASLVEIGASLSGWPQLASGTLQGGAVVTDVVRRILLDQSRVSGRFRIDLEELVGGSAAFNDAAPSEVTASIPEIAAQEARSDMPPEIVPLLEAAVCAPSGGNAQPWRFRVYGHTIECYLVRPSSNAVLDHGGRASEVALGAAIENLSLAAGQRGLAVSVRTVPATTSGPRAVITCAPGTITADALAAQMAMRCTNRRTGAWAPLVTGMADTLRGTATAAGGALHLVTEGERRQHLATALGVVDRVRLLDEALHRELMSELRWDAEEAARGDGIDIATLELSPAEATLLGILRAPRVRALLASWELGAALALPAAAAFDAASAVGLVEVPDMGPDTWLHGGRVMQRVWLQATALGLAVQPWSPCIYLFAQLDHGLTDRLSASATERLKQAKTTFDSVFPLPPGRTPILLLRFFHAAAPSVRSQRMALHRVLLP